MATRESKNTIKTPASVNKVKSTLILLANSTPAAAKKIIKNSNRDVLKAISEICLNILNGFVPLTHAQKKKLKRYRNPMRELTEKKTKVTARRRLLQRGGFLGTILSVGLPLLIKGLGSLISHIKQKRAAKSRR